MTSSNQPTPRHISALSQTGAILLDAYRELNARKMFWIAMVLTAIAVACLAVLGINKNGVSILFWTIEVFPIATEPKPGKFVLVMSESLFYKTLFVSFGFNVWIGWASTILALVATASIIPDFTSSGAIENMLARPISRTRLFLTKYLASLLFVLLLSAFFTIAAIVVIGLRGGVWLWGLWVAVPLITLFFSYIYSVSALVGVFTRSTLAALVAALVFWGALWAFDAAERVFLSQRIEATTPLVTFERDIEAMRLQIKKESDDGKPAERIASLQKRLESRQVEVDQRRKSAESAEYWHNLFYTTKTLFPKTAETKELIGRALKIDDEMDKLLESADNNDSTQAVFSRADRRTAREVERVISKRSVWWVVGSSILFEIVILAWAARIFAKRDF